MFKPSRFYLYNFYYSPQLIDVGAATQTPFAQRAMMDLVQFEQDYSTEYPERLLLALAFNTHPGDFVIQDLLVNKNNCIYYIYIIKII